MYAVIETGSKQYSVLKDDVIEVEKLPHEVGETFDFDRVLFFGDKAKHQIGKPLLENCKVTAEVIGDAKGDKVIAFKFKKRKKYRRKVGHRQKYSVVRIKNITCE